MAKKTAQKAPKKKVPHTKKNKADAATAYKIVKYPLSTEKSIRLMEAENRLVFVVDRKANKQTIRSAIEEVFKAKVVKVNTYIDVKGRKKAYVKFSDATPAIDIATQMGMM